MNKETKMTEETKQNKLSEEEALALLDKADWIRLASCDQDVGPEEFESMADRAEEIERQVEKGIGRAAYDRLRQTMNSSD